MEATTQPMSITPCRLTMQVFKYFWQPILIKNVNPNSDHIHVNWKSNHHRTQRTVEEKCEGSFELTRWWFKICQPHLVIKVTWQELGSIKEPRKENRSYVQLFWPKQLYWNIFFCQQATPKTCHETLTWVCRRWTKPIWGIWGEKNITQDFCHIGSNIILQCSLG